MKSKTLRYNRGDKLVVIKDPRKGQVGFLKGTKVEVLSKDPFAYLCRELTPGRDGTLGAFWVHEKNLQPIDPS
jgi:hypothetical protein